MKVLYVTSEAAPFAASGGLGDVMGALPAAVRRELGEGGEVSVILPLYGTVSEVHRAQMTVECDITDFSSQVDLEGRVEAATNGLRSGDMVKVILTGQVSPESQKSVGHLNDLLASRFYFAKVYDRSRLRMDPDAYRHDISLKGEFVRRVMASNLSEEEKERVITCGFLALTGEEVEL